MFKLFRNEVKKDQATKDLIDCYRKQHEMLEMSLRELEKENKKLDKILKKMNK